MHRNTMSNKFKLFWNYFELWWQRNPLYKTFKILVVTLILRSWSNKNWIIVLIYLCKFNYHLLILRSPFAKISLCQIKKYYFLLMETPI